MTCLDFESCMKLKIWKIDLKKSLFFLFRVRIIFAGDDVTDEDAINALKGMAMTFRIVSNQVNVIVVSQYLPTIFVINYFSIEPINNTLI